MSDSRGVRANFDLDAVAHQLQDKRSSKRGSAAKKLRKARLITAVPALIDALKIEVTDKRTWETQYQMVMALAETGSTEALPLLRNLSSMDLEPMVLLAVGMHLFASPPISITRSMKHSLPSSHLPRAQYGRSQCSAQSLHRRPSKPSSTTLRRRNTLRFDSGSLPPPRDGKPAG